MSVGKSLLRALIFGATRLALILGRNIPRSWNLCLGSLIGRLAYFLLRKERKKTLANLQRALGKEKSTKELSKIAYNVFINLGKNLFELFWASKANKSQLENIASFEGMEYLQQSFNKGKGLIAISPHLGNWELMAYLVSMAGFPVNVIAKRLYDYRLNNLVYRLRSHKGVNTIFREDPSAGKRILHTLKRGEILGILIDQDTKVEGVYVKFFNQLCYTPAGAAILALKSEAKVLFATIARNSNQRHIISFYPPLKTLRTSDKEKDITINTQLYTNLIEASIRKHPDQWIWMHQRWKTKPFGNGYKQI